jgi:hypothetical protein
MDMAACDFVIAELFVVMADLIFEVAQESDGGFVAECLTEAIVSQGDDWISLREAVADAVKGYFFDASESMPKAIRLHLVRDESFALA